MNIIQKLIHWFSRVEELPPKREEERRAYIERRKTHVGYEGPERRSGKDRRVNIDKSDNPPSTAT